MRRFMKPILIYCKGGPLLCKKGFGFLRLAGQGMCGPFSATVHFPGV